MPFEPSNCWNTFAEQHWESSPLTRRNFPSAPPLSPNRLFDLIRKACTDPAFSNDNLVEFFIGDKKVRHSEIGELFPAATDGSFERYYERVKSVIGDRGLCIHASHFECVDYSLWQWGRDFLSQLYACVGMTQLGAEFQVFIGDYRQTPIGIHRDETNVFHFPIIGRKCMRLWSDEFGKRHPELRNRVAYSDYLEGSELLEAEVGGMFYCPSSYWHVGESSGDFSASLVLALYSFPDLTVPLLIQLGRSLAIPQDTLAKARPIVEFDPNNLQGTGEHPPSALVAAVNRIKAQLSDDAVALMWMKLSTAYGFLHPPLPENPAEIAETDLVRLKHEPNAAVVRKLDSGDTAIACDGHLLITSEASQKAVLDILLDGSYHTVGELRKLANGGSVAVGNDDNSGESDFIARMYRIGGLERI